MFDAITAFLSPKPRLLALAVVAVALLVALAAVGVRCALVQAELRTEQATHATTREQLAAAVTEGNRWAAVARQANATADAQAEYTAACIEREQKTATDAAARAAILSTVKPRPRTDAERQEVVDDATRMAAADHLNRPW